MDYDKHWSNEDRGARRGGNESPRRRDAGRREQRPAGGGAAEERCPRLDELVADFGWSRGGPGPLVQTTINGRFVSFLCRRSGRAGPHWGFGVPWSPGIARRKRKRAVKQADELIALALDPAGRRLLESVSPPSRGADGLSVFPAVLDYAVEGDPPPAEKVVEIAEVLAAVAARIESLLDTAM